jgi:hypothetical protein
MRDRKLVIVVIVAVIIGLVLAVVTDTIRLGPSHFTLPPDAMTVASEVIRIPESIEEHDLYYLVVTISNHVTDPSIQPYEAEVTIQTNVDAVQVLHRPPVGYHNAPLTTYFANVDRTFTFPAGAVGYDDLKSGSARWTVRGESLLRSRPIFENQASFMLDVRIDEGEDISLSSVVTVTWYYHSAIQAYPVASRTVTTPEMLIPSGRPSI